MKEIHKQQLFWMILTRMAAFLMWEANAQVKEVLTVEDHAPPLLSCSYCWCYSFEGKTCIGGAGATVGEEKRTASLGSKNGCNFKEAVEHQHNMHDHQEGGGNSHQIQGQIITIQRRRPVGLPQATKSPKSFHLILIEAYPKMCLPSCTDKTKEQLLWCNSKPQDLHKG